MDEISSFVQNYTDLLLLGAAAVTLVGIVGYGLYAGRKVPGEEPMKKETYVLTRRQQRRQESSLVADGVESLLLDLFAKGKIDEERYETWRTRFKKRMGLIELQNKPILLTNEMRKKNAKVRIELLKKQSVPKLVKEKPKPKNVVDALLNGSV